MKKAIYTLALLATVSFASAQTDVKPPMTAQPAKDTTTVVRQVQKESDMKTMDAVKTQDHEKSTPKPKKTSKNKDTTQVKKTRTAK